MVTTLASAELPAEVVTDIKTVLGWIAGIAGVVCVAKIMFVGARIAWDHQHNPGLESPPAAEFLAAALGWILAAGAAVPMAVILIQAGRPPEASTPSCTSGLSGYWAPLSEQASAPTCQTNLVDDIRQKYPPLEEN